MLYHRDGNHHIASYALDGRNRFRKAERAKASGARIEWRLPFESRRKVLVATWEFEWDGERAWMTR